MNDVIDRHTELVKRLETDQTISSELEPATYETSEPWKAWHPIEWKDNKNAWEDMMPVVYSNQVDKIGVLQMSDQESFLLRRDPKSVDSFDEFLPFNTGGRYRVLNSGQIRDRSGWWYIRTDFDCDVDELFSIDEDD